MPESSPLMPAAELAAKNKLRFPNESPEYRRARQALLAEEIEVRRHIERLAAQRRALPPGGEVKEPYSFLGERGPATFADLFGDKQTLVVYNYMFGPQRERPCPMCTAMLSSLEGEARDLQQRVALAIIARSPLEKLLAFKRERGWRDLRLYSDTTGEFSQDYHAINPEGGDDPNLQVFTREGGTIRHFWSGEMGLAQADPGQDPRGHVDLMPIWNVLDCTREGRGTDWYPKLEYGK
jgi:predicted dithiol-disulfide oxidoreductase (DUF899 family)